MFAATFVTGFALAYARSWRLALALSAILPVIMVSGFIMFTAITKFVVGSLEYVSRAGTLAEEVIGSIRTIQAFGTAKVISAKFDANIEKARTTGRKGVIYEATALSVMCKSNSRPC